MTRRDIYIDAMLRHLAAAYYESLHGGASTADVARARAAVEEHLAEQPATVRRVSDGKYAGKPPRITSYKEIVRVLAENKISAVPVLVMGRHVAGVVSEADLLAEEDQAARRARVGETRHLPWRHRPSAQTLPLKAEDVMSKPAITITPDAPIPRAAAVMRAHHIKRLPVVDPAAS
jgi:CBS-domain-containing membrane protein